jgi:dephospho-CoA kinase
MNVSRDWEKLIRRMELLLRLKSFPVAFKMLENKEDLANIPFLRRAEKKVTLCQLITLVRSFDWTVGADLEDFLFPGCPSILGLCDVPEVNKDGTFRSIVWVKTKKDGRKYEAAIPKLPLNKYQAVAMAPLVYNPFEPDIVMIYANPAQMMILINALQFEDYEVMQFFCVGESSCSDAIARCYNTGKPSLTIPCYGERRYGHAQDEDLVMSIPVHMMEKALNGLEALYRRGIRYPISFAGAEGDVGPMFPANYGKLKEFSEQLKGGGKHLLLGVTGGIASGKSTVSDLLSELGSPLIDFDLLARKVVEPGTRGYKDIVDYFGKQVLQENGGLDRKKLSSIVFSDIEKRKKLESFTHPYIYEEFFKEINQITEKQPDAVIQVSVPLLIELNLQFLFDKLLVVYVKPQTQAKRLALRDGITETDAENIMKSQLSIDEKASYADFVIDNEGSLEETKEQVQAVWETLTKTHKQEIPST